MLIEGPDGRSVDSHLRSPSQEPKVFRLNFCAYNRRHTLGLIAAYSKGVDGRVLPLFDNIGAEADAAANEFFH